MHIGKNNVHMCDHECDEMAMNIKTMNVTSEGDPKLFTTIYTHENNPLCNTYVLHMYMLS